MISEGMRFVKSGTYHVPLREDEAVNCQHMSPGSGCQ